VFFCHLRMHLASETLCDFVKYSVMMEEVLVNANDLSYWLKF